MRSGTNACPFIRAVTALCAAGAAGRFAGAGVAVTARGGAVTGFALAVSVMAGLTLAVSTGGFALLVSAAGGITGARATGGVSESGFVESRAATGGFVGAMESAVSGAD